MSSAIRCLNCHEIIQLEKSITDRYPEWKTLLASPGSSKQSTKVVPSSTKEREKGNVLGLNQLTASTSSLGTDVCHSTSSEFSQVGEEEPRSSTGGNLGHFIAMKGNLFDIICGDATPLDHPMCQECSDQLLDCMDQQLRGLEEESENYSSLIDSLKRQQSGMDLNSLRMELSKLQSEERSLQSELSRLEAEEEEIDHQLGSEKRELEQVKREEERLWRVYRDHTRRLLELDQEEQSVNNQLKYATEQLDRLSKTNIFNLTFHIWHAGQFATINGLRLGRLPDQIVDWNEINAAWGQTVLLLSSLCKKLNLKLKRYELVPFGNFSYIKLTEGEMGKELPLYCSGGYKFLGNAKFDTGMVAFLECLQQLQSAMEERGSFRLPYGMRGDRIVDNEREYSVKTQFNSEERWTKAMKCLLTNLKWALAWIASLD